MNNRTKKLLEAIAKSLDEIIDDAIVDDRHNKSILGSAKIENALTYIDEKKFRITIDYKDGNYILYKEAIKVISIATGDTPIKDDKLAIEDPLTCELKVGDCAQIIGGTGPLLGLYIEIQSVSNYGEGKKIYNSSHNFKAISLERSHLKKVK